MHRVVGDRAYPCVASETSALLSTCYTGNRWEELLRLSWEESLLMGKVQVIF